MRHRLPFAMALFSGLLLSACATPGGGDRERLSNEELMTLRPEITEHLTCVSGKVAMAARASESIDARVDTAAAGCRDKLGPFGSKLKQMNLSADAQQRYLAAVESSSREVVTERIRNSATNTAGSNQREANTL